jgi:hypothetical protein
MILTGVVWSEDFKEQLRKYAVLFNQREARASKVSGFRSPQFRLKRTTVVYLSL